MDSKKIFQPTSHANSISLSLFVLRVVAGIAFMLHGWPKIQNPLAWMGPDASIPGFFQLLAAIAEFGGGLAWILGLLFPLATLGIACTMVVAVYMHAFVNGDPFVASGGPSYELAAVYLAISLVFLSTGPGVFSLDAKVFRRK